MTPKSIGFRVLGVEHPSSLLTRVKKGYELRLTLQEISWHSPPFDVSNNAFLGEGTRLLSKKC